jgi:2-desacetyl-2-hydroxyethyl bacteriochlorophyllide A dehydrogenase
MKAIMKDKDAPGFSISSLDEPVCLPGQVIVKPRACGICGSDMYPYYWKDMIRGMMLSRLPVVIGHEFGGEIVEKGSAVKNLEKGDWVVVEPFLSCGLCDYCKTGRSNLCRSSVYFGTHVHGGMAELVAVPEVNCFKVPKTIPFENISLLEVLATAFYGLSRARPVAGSTVAVLGVGAIGLLLVQAARVMGAAKIIAIDVSSSSKRLEIARIMGADETIIVDKEDLNKRILSLTDGGVDLVLEATGTPAGFEESIEIGRTGSQVVLLGSSVTPVSFVPHRLMKKEMDMLTSLGRSSSSWYTAIHLVSSGKISLDNIIDGRFPISDVLHAFELLEKKEIVKAVIEL